MGTFDSFEYDIKSRLPEWWKEDALATSVNVYTQDLIAEILEGLLSHLGLVQPINVWKTIPEEYNWYHHYTILDDYLIYENNHSERINSVCTFYKNSRVMAYLPNTKRDCDARIHLRLLGENSTTGKANIDYLKIYNGNQEIYLRDIPKSAVIDISTETKQVFINGEEIPSKTTGYFDKIQPNIKYEDFLYPNGTEISVQDENKETKIVFESSDPVKFDLQIYLLKPTYVTEQNIRVASVSAFPIEKIELWGYFCHPFNNKQGYEFLWEKKYDIRNRTVYDRITKQYDCERFYVRVKFHGIGTVLTKGFPQEEFASNPVFQTNTNLDKWGKIYGLPRRNYRTEITKDEEPFTYPKYYNYPIEQDYWYEERLVNEYRFVDDSTNSYFIKDTDLNNIARLDCIHPTTDDLWVYTETIKASDNDERSVNNIPVHDIEIIDDTGVDIEEVRNLTIGHPAELTSINPIDEKTLKLNNDSYQTKKYKCSFDLRPYKDQIPKDIKIKGIELKFKSTINKKSNSIRLSDDSCLLLPIYSKIFKDFKTGKVDISIERKYWQRHKNYLTIGGENFLFGEKEITREQLFSGNNEHVEFEIRFINESDFLKAELLLEEVTLNLYYEVIPDKYDINIEIPNKTIYINKTPNEAELNITITNESEKEISDKELFIILPPELKFKEGNNCYKFNFDINEPPFTINTLIEPNKINGEIRTGYYDILIFCEDHVFKQEILVRSGE